MKKAFILAIIVMLGVPVLLTYYTTSESMGNVTSTVSYSAVTKYETRDDFSSASTLCYLAAESYMSTELRNIIGSYLEVKDNQAPGWKYITDAHNKWTGFSWAFWQNEKNPNRYCLVYTGTDDVLDVGQYLPMMIDEVYSWQIKEAINTAKNIKQYAPTKIEELYITGHSLGGYLAAFVASNLVDSYVAPTTTHSNIKVSDIESTLKIQNVKCHTFAAPGFYYTPMINIGLLKALGVNVSALSNWGQEKKSNNELGLYDDTIYNYRNQFDPVGNLCISPQNFRHLGQVIELKINQATAGEINAFSRVVGKQGLLGAFYTIVKPFKIFNLRPTDLYYHMPHNYINALKALVQ